jgi:hypothetical protein
MYEVHLSASFHLITFALDLSVDLRDAVQDRLYLSKGFHRDGVSVEFYLLYPFLKFVQTLFDIGQATALK